MLDAAGAVCLHAFATVHWTVQGRASWVRGDARPAHHLGTPRPRSLFLRGRLHGSASHRCPETVLTAAACAGVVLPPQFLDVRVRQRTKGITQAEVRLAQPRVCGKHRTALFTRQALHTLVPGRLLELGSSSSKAQSSRREPRSLGSCGTANQPHIIYFWVCPPGCFWKQAKQTTPSNVEGAHPVPNPLDLDGAGGWRRGEFSVGLSWDRPQVVVDALGNRWCPGWLSVPWVIVGALGCHHQGPRSSSGPRVVIRALGHGQCPGSSSVPQVVIGAPGRQCPGSLSVPWDVISTLGHCQCPESSSVPCVVVSAPGCHRQCPRSSSGPWDISALVLGLWGLVHRGLSWVPSLQMQIVGPL